MVGVVGFEERGGRGEGGDSQGGAGVKGGIWVLHDRDRGEWMRRDVCQ